MATKFSSPVPQLASAGNEFCLQMYQNLAEDASTNVFFSPVSIFTALAMTYIGARGNTSSQMKAILNFDKLADTELHASFEELNSLLFQTQDSYQLHGANRLYVQKDYNLLDEFLKTVEKHYKAGIEKVDYKTEFEQARKAINSWVKSQTNKKIQNLLQPGTLDSLTRLVLVNAIYFKGNWVKQFDAKRTKDQQFHVSPNDGDLVPMMSMESTFPYLRDDTLKYQVLELPYVENHLSMVVVLPFENDGLKTLESKLSFQVLQNMLKRKGAEKVKVYLPRFKVEQDFVLNDQLGAMGMTDLFDENKCDLSGVSPEGELFVSKVIHKAFVEVNEEGSEAAAATAVVMKKRSAMMPTPKPTFRADHPFLFFIRDNRSGVILFMGRVVQPPKSNKKDEL